MAHPFFSQEEEVSFDPHSKRDTPLPASRAARNDKQQEGGANRRSISCGPTAELDGKTRPVSTRRRTPVACKRCRKRKIKCSGDSGDGRACTNCRSSGTSDCQFLRVKCSVVHTKASCNEWPYPTMGTTISSSPRMGLYAHPTSKAAVLPSHPPSMRVASFSRPASYDLGTVESQHAFPTRQSFAMDQSVNYEDDSTVPYNNAHSSAYTLPGTPSTVLVDYFGPSWNPKAWYPVLPVSKISTGGLYPDQDAGGHLAQSTYSYIVSGQGTAPADIPSLFPAVTPLPSEGQGTDRTLPNPAGRNQLQSDASALVTMSEGVSGFPFSQDFKIGNNWAAKSAATSTSNRTQIPTIPTGTFSSSPVNRTKPSPSNTQDLMFDFLPMPTSSGSPPSLSSSATFTELDSVDSPDEFRTNIDARYARATRAFSRDHGLPDCSPIYSYSTSDSRKNHGDDAGDSVPTLINGLPYTRVRHADTHGALSFNLLPPDPLADYRAVTEVHRTSVAPLSNPVGF